MPTATARREVGDLEATETILASPVEERWVNLLKGVSSFWEERTTAVVPRVRHCRQRAAIGFDCCLIGVTA